MALSFIPDAGDVLMCDFTTGFIPPEMTKLRKVIVLSPRARDHFPDTYIVAPVSKTPPASTRETHCEFKARSYDFFDSIEPVWAKADMLACVSKHRLDRVRFNGQYQRCRIRPTDLHRVRNATIHALGLGDWHEYEVLVRLESYKKSLTIVEVTDSIID
jgi:uncharacterized protein YifN (PemK superfamily)